MCKKIVTFHNKSIYKNNLENPDPPRLAVSGGRWRGAGGLGKGRGKKEREREREKERERERERKKERKTDRQTI